MISAYHRYQGLKVQIARVIHVEEIHVMPLLVVEMVVPEIFALVVHVKMRCVPVRDAILRPVPTRLVRILPVSGTPIANVTVIPVLQMSVVAVVARSTMSKTIVESLLNASSYFGFCFATYCSKVFKIVKYPGSANIVTGFVMFWRSHF